MEQMIGDSATIAVIMYGVPSGWHGQIMNAVSPCLGAANWMTFDGLSLMVHLYHTCVPRGTGVVGVQRYWITLLRVGQNIKIFVGGVVKL